MERKFCTACQTMRLVTEGGKLLQHKTTRRWRCAQCEQNAYERKHKGDQHEHTTQAS